MFNNNHKEINNNKQYKLAIYLKNQYIKRQYINRNTLRSKKYIEIPSIPII